VTPRDDSGRADLAAKHKLPRAKSMASRRQSGNKWVEVDRDEKIKAVLAVAVVLIVLGVGLWFVIRGMMR
jgi:hypothetical protein